MLCSTAAGLQCTHMLHSTAAGAVHCAFKPQPLATDAAEAGGV